MPRDTWSLMLSGKVSGVDFDCCDRLGGVVVVQMPRSRAQFERLMMLLKIELCYLWID